MVRCVAFFFIACLVCPIWALQADKPVQCPPSSFSPAADPKQDAQTFAWELFAYVNKKLQDSEPTILWETWASPQDLYCHAGTNCDRENRPQWPAHNAYTFQPGLGIESAMLLKYAAAEPQASVMAPPLKQEIRINCATFKYISDHDLWSLEGQEDAFKNGQEIMFTPDSMEVKAFWIKIDGDVKDRYHWQKIDSSYYGLVSLSIMSRVLPQWFWATFEHADNPQRCMDRTQCVFDTVRGGTISTGMPPAVRKWLRDKGLKGAEWLNYRLSGTQSTFTGMNASAMSTDAPTVLANSIFESSLVTPTSNTSSCITCHARATVDAQGKRLCILQPNRTGYTGLPLRSWYCDASSGKLAFLPLSFVWSFLEAESIHGGGKPDLESTCGKPVVNGPDCAKIPQLPAQ